MLRWLKNIVASSTALAAVADSPQVPQREPSAKEIFADSALFTNWVEEYLIKAMPWRNAFHMLPDEAAQRDLSITFEQKERLVKEHTVLRIVGVLVFVHNFYGDERYQSLLNAISGRLVDALELEDANARYVLGQALDEYSRGALAEDSKALSILYMRRVYDDSDHYIRMLHAGVGDTAVIELTGSYEAMRDQYFNTVVGHSYETHVLQEEALAKVGQK